MSGSADFNLPDYEKLISCPYNKAHMVVSHRMPKHLMKCRLSHSNIGTKQCRFNCAHVVSSEEIQLHEETCPDRVIVEMFLMDKPATNYNSPADSGFSGSNLGSTVDDGEDWDNCEPVPSYNPKKKCRETDVLVHIQHGIPSVRKEKREAERKRLEKLRSDPRPSSSIPGNKNNN